ncbi:hypothetical protein IAR50_005370 [Cryptococcus sp. DSM 104548]
MGTLDVLTAHLNAFPGSLPTLLGSPPPLYIASAAAITVSIATYLWLYPIAEARIPFRNLPDPGPGNWLFGQIAAAFLTSSPNAAYIQWHKSLGHTIKYRTQFGSYHISTIDPTAISYILHHTEIFGKPLPIRNWLRVRIGNGLVGAEGDHHKRQRKAMTPGFSPAAIRDMAPVFYDVAYELTDKIHTLIAHKDELHLSPSPPKSIDAVPGGAKIDIFKYLNMATFDAVGLAGFGHAFHFLSETKDELADSVHQFLWAALGSGLADYVAEQYLMKIPSERGRVVIKERKNIIEACRRIAYEKKKDILEQSYGEGIHKKQNIGTDFLSLLVKANMASDLKEEERLTDEDVADQILTLLLAGGESSANTISHSLYLLSQHTDVQNRLRAELMSVDEERPSMEILNNLPHLEAVTRECLRVFPAAPYVFRSASEDVTIPLGSPIKGKDGSLMTEFKMAAGNQVFLPILGINTSTSVWGPDAETFNPSRFLDNQHPEKVKISGPYGNLMTFIGGPRNCIGYKFALQNIKVFLFVLLRSHEFRLLKSNPELVQKTAAVVRTFVKGEEHLGTQIPLMVIPLDRSGFDKQ